MGERCLQESMGVRNDVGGMFYSGIQRLLGESRQGVLLESTPKVSFSEAGLANSSS